jgi:hypothetical protein
LGDPAATPPPARRRSKRDEPATGRGVALPATVAREDVSALCAEMAAALEAAGADADVVDGSAVDRPALPTVELLARLALVVRRHRRTMRLEHATPAILELLDLCGLSDVLAATASAPLPPTATPGPTAEASPPDGAGSGGQVVG